MPIDHLLLHAPQDKFADLSAFYLAALQPIAYEKVFEYPGVIGLGANKSADFWISTQEHFPSSGAGVHFALSAPGGSCRWPCYSTDRSADIEQIARLSMHFTTRRSEQEAGITASLV